MMKKIKAKTPKPKAAVKKSSSKTPKSKPRKSPVKKDASSILKSKGAASRLPLPGGREEMQDLKIRLQEAEETIEAIRSGGVDAILGDASVGNRIYTLQGAEHPYRVFFEAMNEGAVTTTFDGTILYCNHRFADLVKVPLEKVTGMSFLDLVTEDSRQVVTALLSETSPENRTIESSMKVQGGTVIPVNISVNLLKTKDLEAVCAVVTDLSELVLMRRFEEANERLTAMNEELRASQQELQASEKTLRDSRRAALNLIEDSISARKRAEEANTKLQQEVAERKKAEEALKESEARYHNLFNTMGEGFCIIEMIFDGEDRPVDYRFLEVNAAFENQTGLHEATGKLMRELAPAHESHWFEIYGKIALTGEPLRFVNEAKALNRWYDVSAYRVGRPEDRHVAIIFNDISVHKRAEAALRESEERYRSLFENMLQGFAHCKMLYDEGGRPSDFIYLDVNSAFGELTGLENVAGRRVTEVIPGIREAHPELFEIYGRVALTGQPEKFEIEFKPLESWLSISVYSPAREHFVAIFDNITERKKYEADVLKLSEDMAARNVELEAVNKELESFIYSISHDLRAPLRSIAGFVNILVEDYARLLDVKGQDYLARIHNGAEKMSRLIEDLLYLSKVSRQEVRRNQVDMSKMATSIVWELREANPGRSVDIRIMEGLTAFADERLIEIILSNLLGNAWKFTSKTAKALIEFGAVEQDGKTVYYVGDNGAGFDPKYGEKMFEPFHRLHSDKEFPGTGIGLTIVERIIHSHGGRVWAEGQTGKGAKIFFTLG